MGAIHFPLKFALKVTHLPVKIANFDQYLLNVSTVRASENVQLSRIGSRPRSFQGAIDEVLTLLLTPPKRGSKNEFVVFVKKVHVQSNKVSYKVFLCKNFQRRIIVEPFPYLMVYSCWR